MADIADKNIDDRLQKTRPEGVENARAAIELAQSFPVKGGDVVPKKEGGWFEAIKKIGPATGRS